MEELEVTDVEVQQSSIPTEAEVAGPTPPVRRKRGRPFLSRGGGGETTPIPTETEVAGPTSPVRRKRGRPFLSRGGGGETTPRSERQLGGHLSSESRVTRVNLPKPCLSAIQSLKVELGLRNADETVRWLLHQFRPGLVPGEPPRPSQNAQKPTCMPRPVGDQQVSMPHLPFPAAGVAPARRTRVRATVVQASTVFLDTPATLDKAERLICSAAAYGSELLVFPEAFVGGYPRCVMFDTVTPTHSTETDDFQKYYAAAIEVPGPEVDKLAKIASKYKVQLVMGVVERCGYYVYSTVLFFDSQGQHIGHHRKLKPMASESTLWYPGEKSTLPIYETAVGKIGGFICWDNKLPLLRAELYSKGIEMYCAPTADAGEVWKASMTHIAVEGGCFVLSANQFCRRKDYLLPPGGSPCDPPMDAITSAGGSIIISPTGAILAGPNYKGECLISADLDLSEISRAKIEVCSHNVGSKHVDGTTNGPNPVGAPEHLR